MAKHGSLSITINFDGEAFAKLKRRMESEIFASLYDIAGDTAELDKIKNLNNIGDSADEQE